PEPRRHLVEARQQAARGGGALLHDLADGLALVEHGLLRQQADRGALGWERLTRDVMVHASHDAQEPALARAVVTEYPDLRAGVEGEPDALQDLVTLRGDLAEILHGEDELRHRGGRRAYHGHRPDACPRPPRRRACSLCRHALDAGHSLPGHPP